MAKVFIEESTLSAIGDSIRAKTGKTDMIPPLSMPAEIESIQGGGGDSIIKTVSGVCPITLEDCAERNLLDYKIYGNEGGVGNKTKNLCKGEFNVSNAKFDEPIPAGTVISVSASAKGYDASVSTKRLRVRFFDSAGTAITNFYPTLDSTGTRIKMDNLSYTKDIYSYWLTNLNAEEVQIEIGSTHTAYEPYGYSVDVKVNDDITKIYLAEQLGIEDYIDFENRKVVIGGVPTLMELPELPLIEGNNTFDVDTTVKPTNVDLTYVKKVEFNTMKTVEGTLPLTIEGVGQRLEDYKIYGNEGGVGDQTENLFDKHYNVGYNGTAPNVIEAPDGLSTEWYAIEDIGTDFTLALNPNIATTSIVVGYVQSNDKSTIELRRGFINASAFTVEVDNFRNFQITNTSYKYVKFYANNATLINDVRIYKGSGNNLTVPYGFYVPIKINNNEYKLILDAPINNGDCLDYENRCITKSDGTKTYLDLPEIYLQNGQNVIDVDTAVKPSKMTVSFVDNDGGYAVGYKEGYEAMKLAVDMSDVTYRFNEEVTSYPSNWYRINLNFTDANGVEYKQIAPYTSSSKININYTPVTGSSIVAFNAANTPMWADEAYRTIHIKDGSMIGDIETFRWLLKNGQFI